MSYEPEINDQSTPEEVKAYAETILQEVKKDRQGEKSDSEIISGQANNKQIPEPPASNDSVVEDNNDDLSISDVGDDSAKAIELPKWVDDDAKAEISAYGLKEAEIADFASREELDRALRLFDKNALELGQKALVEDDKPKRNDKGQFEKNDEGKSESESPNRYQVSLDKDLYDEDLIKELSNMQEFYETRISSLEGKFNEVFAKSEEQQFDSMVDSLGLPSLFGETGKETEVELQRRQDLNVASKAQAIGLERLGRPTEINKSLLSRVARMVFAEEFAKEDLKQRTRKISRQSNWRQGGGATKPQPPSLHPREEAERLYRELERG